MSAPVELVVPVLAAIVSGGCAAYVGVQKYAVPGARAYSLVMIAQCWWSLGYVEELLAHDLPSKVFWDDVQLPPPYIVTFALLYFAYQYAGASTRGLRRAMPWLAILPIATCLFVFSDGLHHLARASAHIAEDPPFGALLYDFSPIELLSFAEVYAVGFYAAYRLLRNAHKQAELHRRQAILVSAGTLLGLLGGLPSLLGYRWFGQRDSSPLWFAISGLCVTWALTRYQLFDLVPIARDAVIENLPDPIFVLDAKNRLLDVNPAARALLDEKNPKLGEDALKALPAWLTEGLTTTSEQQDTRQFRRPDGKASYEISEAALLSDDGSERGRAVILRDNTERRRARELLRKAHADLELRVVERTQELESANASLRTQIEETRVAEAAAQESERKFRAIFDGAYELIGMMTPEGRILEPNRAALSLAGVSSEDVRGQLVWDTPWWAHSSEQREQLKHAVSAAARGKFVRFEVTHVAAGGDLRIVDFSITPILQAGGGVASLVAEGRDITELKRAEEENTRLQAQLYQAQKLDSIGRLAGGVAHDFNNLLTVILGNVDLARSGEPPSPRLREHLGDIEQATLSAAALTRQLLAFARRQIVEPRVIDLNASVHSVEKLLARLLGEDIEVRLELEPELWRVRVDPSHAEQMLINLAVNARDAMPKGGRLIVRSENRHCFPPKHWGAQVAADYVVLSVTDHGVGIGADVLPQIFEPFFTTKPQGMGTGLGLAMVYGAMQQASGMVDVESTIGRGTTFTLYFPRSAESTMDSLRPLASHPPRGSESIALVEDQALVRATTKRQLEALGYQVIDFASAEEALPALRHTPNLVLLVADVVLARSSGRELAEQLRAARPNLRVMFISGYTEDVVLRHGIELGEVSFLAKPFTIAELAQAVRRALDAPLSEVQREDSSRVS
ncbi:MAG TPA: histidine kinase N-terminal 7TM domain-containing protein [Polyangiaceae bacterium]|nr:histidine kinase N-terminal 7TM domain-containing protein [Polyangiaceae bacterium]